MSQLSSEEKTHSLAERDLYICAMCKGSFIKCSPAGTAEAELAETFPGVPMEECAIVCDDCYKKVMGDE